MAKRETEESRLFLVYLEITGDEQPEMPADLYTQLTPSLFLVRSTLTRSGLYHAVKRRNAPTALLVAPLEEAPKFKGMNEGSLKWLRSMTRD